MSKGVPLTYTWDGQAMVPVPRLAKIARERFEVGQRYQLEEVQDRDMIKHRRQFAFIKRAWENLPEQYASEPWAQSPDHLRRFALIKEGFANTETFTCGSKAEAMRWASQLRADNEYAIVTVQGSTIYRFTAMSQSTRAMGAKMFYESRAKVMAFIDNLLGLQPGETAKQEESA